MEVHNNGMESAHTLMPENACIQCISTGEQKKLCATECIGVGVWDAARDWTIPCFPGWPSKYLVFTWVFTKLITRLFTRVITRFSPGSQSQVRWISNGHQCISLGFWGSGHPVVLLLFFSLYYFIFPAPKKIIQWPSLAEPGRKK